MIVLDTNGLSEVLRPKPEPRVLAWVDEQPVSSVFTTAVTQGEVLYGIRLLADGQRRRKLWEAASTMFDDDFAGRVLSFDAEQRPTMRTLVHPAEQPVAPSPNSMRRLPRSLALMERPWPLAM